MNPFKRVVARTLEHAQKQFESRRLRTLLTDEEALSVQTYRTFGTANRLHVKGRVLIDPRLAPARDDATVLVNLLNAYRRLNSREVPNAELELRFGSLSTRVRSDEEGYFSAEIELKQTLVADDSWVSIAIDVLAPQQIAGAAEAHVLIPPGNPECGIISDLDDTVMKTGATALTSMVRTVLLENSHTREPFEGVADFYRALQRGQGGSALNPIFYVSSGPWNLYDLYADFMDIREVPAGPIMLTDYGIDETKLIHPTHTDHKLSSIRTIFETYPNLSFILIGDSGQEDPEIYRQVVREFPKRVRAIYIRDVTLPERDRVILETGNELQREGVEMILVENTALAAEHAAERGFIAPLRN